MGRWGGGGCGLGSPRHLADKCRRSCGAGENSVDWSGCKHKDTCGPAGSRAGKTSRGREGNKELEPRTGYIPPKTTLLMANTFPQARVTF